MVTSLIQPSFSEPYVKRSETLPFGFRAAGESAGLSIPSRRQPTARAIVRSSTETRFMDQLFPSSSIASPRGRTPGIGPATYRKLGDERLGSVDAMTGHGREIEADVNSECSSRQFPMNRHRRSGYRERIRRMRVHALVAEDSSPI